MGRDNNQNLFSGSQENEHFEVRFPCDECEYVSNEKGNLKQHKEAQHYGVFHPCAKCEYVATSSSNLKLHLRTNHHLGQHLIQDDRELCLKAARQGSPDVHRSQSRLLIGGKSGQAPS